MVSMVTPWLFIAIIQWISKMAMEMWLNILKDAKKTVIIQDGKKKVHFLLNDGREFVEEYNIDTNIVTRRAWREKGKFDNDMGWRVEIGDPEPRKNDHIDVIGIREISSTPIVSRRILRTALEWRIRNLPYPKEVYSVNVNQELTNIVISTTNKKYYKTLDIPDLERCGAKIEPERLSFDHKHNTLIITYKKPPALLNLENKIFQEISKLKVVEASDVQCPVN